MSPSIKIGRQELYDLVWSKPVVQVAKDFGISDVAVGKICKKLNIPKPGLGYWAKKRHGKRNRQTPLPKLKSGDPETFTIKGSMDPNLNLTSELIEKQKAFESTSSHKITVKKTLHNPHSLVEQTLQRRKAYDIRSYHEWRKLPPGLTMSVSKESFSRAIRIMDALIKALEKRGYTTTAKSGYDGYTAVIIDEGEIKFDIFEFSKKIPNPKKSERLFESETILEPTGRLSLRIQNYFAGQRTISDGKTQKLEDCLSKFILLLVKTSEIKKIRTQKAAEREKLREEERQKEQEIALKKQQKEDMLNQLFTNADTWNKCKQVREYIAGVRDNSDGDEMNSWVFWASRQVEGIESKLLNPNNEC
jgi:hypothetical protein